MTELEEFEETHLVRIKPEESTLPLDTAREMTSGYLVLKKLIVELAKERFVEEFEDSSGKARKRTKLHPQLPTLLKEWRLLTKQLWQMSGGEAANEAKKEMSKLQARMIFEANNDPITKKKYKDDVLKIIEAEIDYDDKVKD